ncbi:flagellar protein FliS [Bacillus altitudinis]
MVYEGCLKFIRVAKHGIEKEDGEMRKLKVKKGEKMMEELNVSLNGRYDV